MLGLKRYASTKLRLFPIGDWKGQHYLTVTSCLVGVLLKITSLPRASGTLTKPDYWPSPSCIHISAHMVSSPGSPFLPVLLLQFFTSSKVNTAKRLPSTELCWISFLSTLLAFYLYFYSGTCHNPLTLDLYRFLYPLLTLWLAYRRLRASTASGSSVYLPIAPNTVACIHSI